VTRYELSPAAEDDLTEILDRVAQSSVSDAAERVLVAFLAAFERIADASWIGHTREDWTDEPVRFWIVYSFSIIYPADVQPVNVARIWHGARAP